MVKEIKSKASIGTTFNRLSILDCIGCQRMRPMFVEQFRVARHDFPPMPLDSEKQLRCSTEMDGLSPELSLDKGRNAHAIGPATNQGDVKVDL